MAGEAGWLSGELVGSTIIPAAVGALGYLGAQGVEKLIGFLVFRTNETEAWRSTTVQQIVSVIFETRDLANLYWSQDDAVEGQKQRAASINGRLTFIVRLVEELFADSEELAREVRREYKRFHEACTSGDFQVSTRSAQPERCQEVEVQAYMLVHMVTKLRRSLRRKVLRR